MVRIGWSTGPGRMTALPLALIILFLGAEILGHLLEARTRARNAEHGIQVMETINALVHELQRERGYSSGVLASNGRALWEELQAQRVRTDRTLDEVLLAWMSGARPDRFDQLSFQIARLSQWRAEVDAYGITPAEAVRSYTTLVDALLIRAVMQAGTYAPQERLSRLRAALIDLAMAKESAGLQRAAGAEALGGGVVDDDLHARFIELGARERTYLHEVRLGLVEEGISVEALEDTVFQQVEVARALISGIGYGAREPDLTAAEWFALSTAWIDTLHRLDQQLAEEVTALSHEVSDQAHRALILRGGTVLLALLLIAASMGSAGTARAGAFDDADETAAAPKMG